MDERIFRARAREVLRGNWGISITAAVLASLLGALMVGSSFLPDLDSDLAQTYGFCIARPKAVNTFIIGLNMAAFVIGGVVQLGYCKFLLRQHDGEPYELKDLFSQFHRFTDGFLQNFLRIVYTTLWTLVFIIPGIMASYSYAMTPFLMAENPDLRPNEAISLSKDMMNGHKGELFALDLSFIGWSILCILTLNIGRLWLNPYQNAAYAAFYRGLRPAHNNQNMDYHADEHPEPQEEFTDDQDVIPTMIRLDEPAILPQPHVQNTLQHRWTEEEDFICCKRFLECYVIYRSNIPIEQFLQALSKEVPNISTGSLRMKIQNIKYLSVQSGLKETSNINWLSRYSKQCERTFYMALRELGIR